MTMVTERMGKFVAGGARAFYTKIRTETSEEWAKIRFLIQNSQIRFSCSVSTSVRTTCKRSCKRCSTRTAVAFP